MCFSHYLPARLFALACMMAGMLSITGCSSVKVYPDALPRNMQVLTDIDPGSQMPDAMIELNIYRVKMNCSLQYEGQILVGNGKSDIGIPADSLLYLDFIPVAKGKPSGPANIVRYATLLNSRLGYSYKARVSYFKDIYSVVIRESSNIGSVRRNLEQIPLSECRPRL